MATAPERLLRQLEWRVLRRLDGRIQGDHRTVMQGHGMDVADVRPYGAGDDARHIDWNVTARLNEPHVRRFTEEREVTVWLVLDCSASMRFGVPDRGKDDVLAELGMTITRMFTKGGNRVGAILYDDRSVQVIPPRSGRNQALMLARALGGASPAGAPGTSTDITAMLRLAASTIRRRSLVVVISDLIGDPGWDRELTRLGHRNEVVVLRVTDPVETELPAIGTVIVEDAETGAQLLVDVSDPLFRDRFGREVETQALDVRSRVARSGAVEHVVSTDHDLVDSLVSIVRSTQWRSA